MPRLGSNVHGSSHLSLSIATGHYKLSTFDLLMLVVSVLGSADCSGRCIDSQPSGICDDSM